ncbi:MAG: ABC transporter ATP-binding protein [Bacilli bacterium]
MKKGLFRFYKVVWKDALLAIFFILLETVLETFVPYMFSQIVDVGIVNNDLNYIYFWGAMMILAATLSFIIGIIGVRFIARVGQGYGAELRRQQFIKLQELDIEKRNEFAVSSLITRLTNDTYTIQNAIIIGMRGLFRAPFMITMVLVLSFSLNAKMAMIFAVTLPIVTILMLTIVFTVRPIYETMQRRFDELNRTLQENFQAIRVVKAYVTEEKEIKKFNKINNDYRKVATSAFTTVSLNIPFMQLGVYATIVGLLFIGGNLINTGEAKIGEITGLLTYVLQLLNALLMLAQLLIMFSRTLAASARIKELLNTENTLVFNDNSTLKINDGTIEVKHLKFKFPDTPENIYILNDISFTLRKGETLGIIGQTGSGKSTLVHLLARLYDINDGDILIDGYPLNEFREEEILNAINIVYQNNMLFSGSIIDNLRWGNEKASEADIEKALKASLSDEIVNKLNDGLHSEVGQAGANLSGGQKQRLSLARALLKNPKVLIIDDALSAIDTINEAKIRTNLAKYYPNLSLIMVSQRISAIKNADHILVLHEGVINGEGTHDNLLKNNEIYKDIYDTQLKGAEV